MGICGSKSVKEPERYQSQSPEIDAVLRYSEEDLANKEKAEEARLVLNQYIASKPRNAAKLKQAEDKLSQIKLILARSEISNSISPKVARSKQTPLEDIQQDNKYKISEFNPTASRFEAFQLKLQAAK